MKKALPSGAPMLRGVPGRHKLRVHLGACRERLFFRLEAAPLVGDGLGVGAESFGLGEGGHRLELSAKTSERPGTSQVGRRKRGLLGDD